ncbi:MAG: PstS family phosphate ABC transporter substrate-binding protein [bacterium]
MKKLLVFGLLGIMIFGFVGCEQEEAKRIDLSNKEEAKTIIGKNNSNSQVEKNTVVISGAWALYPMVIRWAEEFKKNHPKIKFDISSGGAGKGMSDALANVVDIGMVSRKVLLEEIDKRAYAIAVTKDAVVPTINADNPYLNAILEGGIKKQTFIDIWITGKITSWQKLLPEINIARNNDIHIYTRSDDCGAAETWAEYLSFSQKDLRGTGVYGDPGVAEIIKKDPLGIGFNNINYAYDSKTKMQVKGLRVIPIDLNDNGKIDPEENFYNHQNNLIKAITNGIYPSPPARDLYFVTYGKPKRTAVVEFIKWVLTDGQQYIAESGYINLSKNKIMKELKKIEK